MIRAETKKVNLGNNSKKFSMPENGPPKARRRAWKAFADRNDIFMMN